MLWVEIVEFFCCWFFSSCVLCGKIYYIRIFVAFFLFPGNGWIIWNGGKLIFRIFRSQTIFPTLVFIVKRKLLNVLVTKQQQEGMKLVWKMYKKRVFQSFFLIIIFFFSLSICSSGSSGKIAGQWQYDKNMYKHHQARTKFCVIIWSVPHRSHFEYCSEIFVRCRS